MTILAAGPKPVENHGRHHIRLAGQAAGIGVESCLQVSPKAMGDLSPIIPQDLHAIWVG
jgi:hypothetical protein